jgi:hypothetical protein
LSLFICKPPIINPNQLFPANPVPQRFLHNN